jgi:hypothetical protein
VTLEIARMKADVRATLDGAGVTDVTGAERFHGTVREAVSGERSG